MKFKLFFFLSLFIFLEAFNPEPVGYLKDYEHYYDYRVVISAISLENPICISDRDYCLSRGIWMKYFDQNNNILLTGHSFSLSPLSAGVFYSLSELRKGDLIKIFLENMFVYTVEEVFVVDKFDIDIENFDDMENTLVLYSCFPLWSASQRIVVRGRLCNFCDFEI